jgi:hypothetical protein
MFVDQLIGINLPDMDRGRPDRPPGCSRPRSTTFDRLDAWMPVAALTFAAFVAVRADGMPAGVRFAGCLPADLGIGRRVRWSRPDPRSVVCA